ncbi:MAG: hypothetical protein EOM50_23325, partial [Erysipelotrichia bacterium]|nr:hypothetical protein [Erysipelotrichia bacterium]
MSDIVEYSVDTFDSIKHVNEEGQEFWYARELQKVLDYAEWRNLNGVIDKARIACEQSGNLVLDHFVNVNKMVRAGVADKEINDIMHEMNMINIETNKNLNQITTYQLQLDQILNEMKQGVLLINSKDELIYYNDDARKLFDLSEQSLNHSIYQIIRNSQLNEAIKKANTTHQNGWIDFTHHQQTIEAKIFSSINPKSYDQNTSLLVLLKDVSQERMVEQMKKDFFSHASHELKSPLTAIKGHAELIMHGIVKNEDIHKSLEQILK